MQNTDYPWFYEIEGKQFGPITHLEIMDLIERKILTAQNLVWQQDFVRWFAIKDTTLSVYFSNHPIFEKPPSVDKSTLGNLPPISNTNHYSDNANNIYTPAFNQTLSEPLFRQNAIQNIDNTLVWILAFAPIIGSIIELIFEIWFATLIINIFLCYLDEKNLKELGINTEKFNGFWIILVPVYLYKRAKFFNHDMGYFIVWVITFVISLFIGT